MSAVAPTPPRARAASPSARPLRTFLALAWTVLVESLAHPSRTSVYRVGADGRVRVRRLRNC